MESLPDITRSIGQLEGGDLLSVMLGLVGLITAFTGLLKTRFGGKLARKVPKKWRMLVPTGLALAVALGVMFGYGTSILETLVLVFAGPASGHTHDLMDRIRELLRKGDPKIGPEDRTVEIEIGEG